MTPAPPPSAAEPPPAALIAARPHLAYDPARGLVMDGVALAPLAERFGTPLYVYDADEMARRFAALGAHLPERARIHYAVKANDHLAILRLFAELGSGFDIVSGGELGRLRTLGVDPGRIIFSGVGKTDEELREAIAAGVGQINIESAGELARIAALAKSLGRPAAIAFRVNPGIDAGTHAKITTGRREDKFGIPEEEAFQLYTSAAADEWLRPVGLAVHIGSQITALAPFERAYRRLAELALGLRAAGHRLERLDLGGGLGISYRTEPALPLARFGALLERVFGALEVALAVEPGRFLVGPAGILLTRVIGIKETPHRRFVIVDAAMNDLIRPALYEAWHGIVPVSPLVSPARDPESWPLHPADVVGPVCETGDTFARARPLPPLAGGEILAILDTGAYGRVMASTYNARPQGAEVMIAKRRAALIRPRQRREELWAHEIAAPFEEDFPGPSA
jgi:diaminopimelate decarboxylase